MKEMQNTVIVLFENYFIIVNVMKYKAYIYIKENSTYTNLYQNTYRTTLNTITR